MKNDRLDEYPRPGGLARRDFLKIAGGGVIVAVSLDDLSGLQEARRQGPSYPEDFNAYLRVGEDGRVTGFTGKIEMGQGAITSLPQMIADELDVPVDSVDMVMGDTDLCPWDMGTFGSQTTRYFGPALRAAAAEARSVLLELASEKLEVPKDRLAVRDGVVHRRLPPGREGLLRRARRGEADRAAYHAQALAQAGRRVEGHGQALPPQGRPRQGHGKGPVRRRYPPAGHALRQGPPAAGPRREAEGPGHVGGGKGRGGPDPPGRRPRRRPSRAPRRRPKRPWPSSRPNTTCPKSKLDDENIFDHLRSVAPEAARRGRGRGPQEGRSPRGRPCSTKRCLNGYVAHAPMETHTALAERRRATRPRSGPRPRRRSGSRTRSPRPSAFRPRTSTSSCRLSAADSAARPGTSRPSRPPGCRSSPGSRSRSPGAGPTNSSTTPSGPAAVVKIRSGMDGGGQDRFLGLRGPFRRGPELGPVLRHPPSPDRLAGRNGAGAAGRPSVRGRGLAGAGLQHQHLRPRVPDRRHGRESGSRSARVPDEEPGRRADEAGPPGRRGRIRLEAGRRPERPRRRRRLLGLPAGPMSPPRPRSTSIQRPGTSRSRGSSAPRTWASASIPRGRRSRSKDASRWASDTP